MTGLVNADICIKLLWQEGFFGAERNLSDVSKKITERWGHNFSAVDISKGLAKANFLIRSGKRGFFRYKQKINPLSKETQGAEHILFSKELVSGFGRDFEIELSDLRANFGHSGNCTAFLIRKILEKSIYIVFVKNGMRSKLEMADGRKLIGLEAMVNLAAKEKIEGTPILSPKTAQNIMAIKFLGDVAAHNPLVDVDMETILPQMPFIITAYKELIKRF